MIPFDGVLDSIAIARVSIMGARSIAGDAILLYVFFIGLARLFRFSQYDIP